MWILLWKFKCVFKFIISVARISLFAFAAPAGVRVTCAPASSTPRLSAVPLVNCLLSTEDYFKAVFVPDSDKLIISWSWANAKSCEGEIKFHCK